MKSQKELIDEGEWNVLVVLDACRFDVFKEIYPNFFEGILVPVDTEAGCTGEWLVKTFPDYYDVTYVSGMPHINSKGLSLNETDRIWEWEWTASKHFSNIIDVWDFGFSKDLGTVPPEAITETAKNIENEKMILHYAQPHFPAISLAKKIDRHGGRPTKYRKIGEGSAIRKRIGRLLERIFGKVVVIQLRHDILGREFRAGFAGCYVSEEGIEYHYKENLKIALDSLKRLVESYDDKKVIVTSDHGEYLGENGKLGHKRMAVPWMEVKETP